MQRRAWLRVIAHEPFFQFIVLGLVIWGAVYYWQVDHDRYTIHLGPAERQRIAVTYLRQFGQSPTPRQFQGLIDRYIREEIFLREGLALNLDKNDEIVRRRIVQKYEFLQTDLAVADSPVPAALQHWFERNKQRYVTPEQIAFSHVYFSADKDGVQATKERAVKVLEKLRAKRISRAPDVGDVFPGPSDVGALPPGEVASTWTR